MKQGWKHSALLTSDEHWDNAKCNRALMKRIFDDAKSMDAPILLGGDFFCAMQGKWDPRSSETGMRDEHRGGNYLDRMVSTAADWLEPYSSQLAVFGRGNHETSIQKRHETDLTERLTERLKDRTGSQVQAANYSYWVTYRFWISKTQYQSITQFTHHGWGGGGPVTQGAIDYSRLAGAYGGAAIFHLGHVHYADIKRWERVCFNPYRGVPEQESIWFCRTPGFKEEVMCGSGWAVEKGHLPKPQGACFLDFSMHGGLVSVVPRYAV